MALLILSLTIKCNGTTRSQTMNSRPASRLFVMTQRLFCRTSKAAAVCDLNKHLYLPAVHGFLSFISRRAYFIVYSARRVKPGARCLASACGSRTHPNGSAPFTPVLKTGRHTGVHPRPSIVLYISFGDVRIAVPDGQPRRVEMLQQRLRIFSGDAERIAQTSKRDPGGPGRARNSARGHIRAL